MQCNAMQYNTIKYLLSISNDIRYLSVFPLHDILQFLKKKLITWNRWVRSNTGNLFVFATTPEKVNKIPAIVLGVPGYLLNVFWN